MLCADGWLGRRSDLADSNRGPRIASPQHQPRLSLIPAPLHERLHGRLLDDATDYDGNADGDADADGDGDGDRASAVGGAANNIASIHQSDQR
jgi:hypothetical protein